MLLNMPCIRIHFRRLIDRFRAHQSEERELKEGLNTSQGRPAISVHLPPDTVPHASSKYDQNTADNGVLPEIFKTSPSVRGYQTASDSMRLPAPNRSSFDVNFKFGSKDSEAKPTSRLGQLGSHLKQKLSEGRLSMSSSRGKSDENKAPTTPAKTHPSTLGLGNSDDSTSQKSNGLLELLMSRTGSEGGYDSDAKSIRTTMLKVNDDTIKSSRSAAKVAPDSLNMSVVACPSPNLSPKGDTKSNDSSLSDPNCNPGAPFVEEKYSSDICGQPNSDLQKKDVRSPGDLPSDNDSDQLSVHLYNMRISQMLRPTSSHTTTSHSKRPSLDVAIPAKRRSNQGYSSSRVTVEHNRRPSDPQTRQLFELAHQAKSSKWRSITSLGSGVSGLSGPSKHNGDDGSSFYWSDGELGPAENSPRIPPKRHINSLAVGGCLGSLDSSIFPSHHR